eukprot:4493426-Pleurochrysis_carterae.AAC.1
MSGDGQNECRKGSSHVVNRYKTRDVLRSEAAVDEFGQTLPIIEGAGGRGVRECSRRERAVQRISASASVRAIRGKCALRAWAHVCEKSAQGERERE